MILERLLAKRASKSLIPFHHADGTMYNYFQMHDPVKDYTGQFVLIGADGNGDNIGIYAKDFGKGSYKVHLIDHETNEPIKSASDLDGLVKYMQSFAKK